MTKEEAATVKVGDVLRIKPVGVGTPIHELAEGPVKTISHDETTLSGEAPSFYIYPWGFYSYTVLERVS